jgi:hypothetical protein
MGHHEIKRAGYTSIICSKDNITKTHNANHCCLDTNGKGVSSNFQKSRTPVLVT